MRNHILTAKQIAAYKKYLCGEERAAATVEKEPAASVCHHLLLGHEGHRKAGGCFGAQPDQHHPHIPAVHRR